MSPKGILDRHHTVGGGEEERLYGRMMSRMLGLFGHRPWVADVVHSAFETFLRKRDTWRGEGSIEAFADAIALNAARDCMRRQRLTAIWDALTSGQDDWPALAPSPEAETADRDRVRRLQAVLEKIGPKLRIPYLLRNVEGMAIEDIARIEGASVQAVRKRITRARAKVHARALKDPVLKEWLAGIEGRSR